MFVDFNQRAGAVGRLRHAITFGPVLHGSLPARLPAPAATAAAPIAAIAAATTTEPAFGLGPRFVDGQRTAAHLILVEFRRRLLRLFVRSHFHERKPARAASGGIAHHADRFDGAGLAEELLQFLFTRAVRKVPDVKPATHTLSPQLRHCPRGAPGRPGVPLPQSGGGSATARQSLGGSESDLRLDRLSARAKQAGLT